MQSRRHNERVIAASLLFGALVIVLTVSVLPMMLFPSPLHLLGVGLY
jgi:hypothetical protein